MCFWIWVVEQKVNFLDRIVGEQLQLMVQRNIQEALRKDIDHKSEYFRKITGLTTDVSGKNGTIRECCKTFADNSKKECEKLFSERRYARMELEGMEMIAELVFGSGSKEAIQKFLEADLKKMERLVQQIQSSQMRTCTRRIWWRARRVSKFLYR
jgi:hypothetical protein